MRGSSKYTISKKDLLYGRVGPFDGKSRRWKEGKNKEDTVRFSIFYQTSEGDMGITLSTCVIPQKLPLHIHICLVGSLFSYF